MYIFYFVFKVYFVELGILFFNDVDENLFDLFLFLVKEDL